LDFTQKVKKRILETSGAHNPVEPQPEKEFSRNSKENIKNWKNRLTQEEISLIKRKTSDLADLFYTQDDW
jgi:adenine C2-methylase RlmN of 23S rRNA A2503 and tRNA A37